MLIFAISKVLRNQWVEWLVFSLILEATTVPSVQVLVSCRGINIKSFIRQLRIVQRIVHVMNFDRFIIKLRTFVFYDVICLLRTPISCTLLTPEKLFPFF